MGHKPTKIVEFERRLRMIKDFMNGRSVEWAGTEMRLEWAADAPDIPLYVAGYGPRALGVAGRVGDGVIIQLADPAIIEWTMATARRAAEEAGRDPAALKCLVCAPSLVSDDIARARDEVRWFPAMVGNHVADIIRVHGETSAVPRELTDYIKGRDEYDYKDHSRVGAAHGAFVPDEICDRFCVIGSAGQIVEKLRGLQDSGVDEWIVYLMTSGQEETLAAYGAEIIPAVNS
jgi:alkanesulfonate monooxygenase SsuD/methylene tetrahydromethanopterin reductase-like flavin-dependent oxidoreductase (luciferase family)